MRANNLKPVLVYGSITAVFGVSALIMAIELLYWLPVFLPLVIVAFWESYKRRERSLRARLSTVFAAGFMLPVYVSAAGLAQPLVSWGPRMVPWDVLTLAESSHQVWLITANMTAFFVGAIIYVRTIVRKRGDQTWLLGSTIGHGLVAVVAGIWWAAGWVPHVNILLVLCWIAITIRAYVVPKHAAKVFAEQRKMISLKRVGYSELGVSIALILSLLI